MEIPKTRVLFDRKNVSTKTRKASVIIEVYYQRQRKFFTTGVELYKDQWKKDMVVGRQDSLELMARIKAIKERIDDYINERLKNNKEINLEHLRSWIDGHSEGISATMGTLHQGKPYRGQELYLQQSFAQLCKNVLL